MDSLGKAYGGRALFSDLSFEIGRGHRIAVIGANGSGKTTLLRALTGEEPADSGTVAWAKGAGMVSYNQVLEKLDDDDTVTHAVNAMPDSLALTATKKSVNRFLAMFRFSEADLKQRIGNLSGGLRARVAMAQCLLSGASVLLLDEPTNHLDLSHPGHGAGTALLSGCRGGGQPRSFLHGQDRQPAARVQHGGLGHGAVDLHAS